MLELVFTSIDEIVGKNNESNVNNNTTKNFFLISDLTSFYNNIIYYKIISMFINK